MPTDFYDVLGAPADASSEELKRAYRSRVREFHPDVNDHPEGDAQFKLIRKANDVLSNPAERKDYDRMGHREYIDKRLDDELPPFSVIPELEDTVRTESNSTTADPSAGGSPSESSEGGAGSESSSTSATSTSSRRSSGTNRSSATGPSGRTQSADPTESNETAASTGSGYSTGDERSTGGSRSTGNGATTSSRSTTSRRSTGSSQSPGDQSTDRSDSQARASGGTSAGVERSPWDDVTGQTARATATGSSTTSRRRRGLRRWYGVVLVSLLAYLGGLATYAAPYTETLVGLANEVTTAPAAALTSPFPLPSPMEYVLRTVNAAAAGEPAAGVLLVIGAVALPLVVLTAVAQFGQGSAWIYALASLGPAVSLAVADVAQLPTALALAGLGVLPLLSGLGFLFDVGRYLYATR